jgi:hypothetical protein
MDMTVGEGMRKDWALPEGGKEWTIDRKEEIRHGDGDSGN